MNKKQLLDILRKKGFSEKIINAFEIVRREDFIPGKNIDIAYENIPVSIGYGQTVSQPYTIAFMLEMLNLENNLKILEVGSGSGYVLALIKEISKNSDIYGIERIKELFERSKKTLKNKGIKIIHGDGSQYLEGRKFNRILVSASCKEIPQKLISQLSPKGILVAPLKDSIVVLEKERGRNKIREFPGFVFVPLIEGKN
jgi:protein-L-isoaspartate(D-aspartate) O-methyltransferase